MPIANAGLGFLVIDLTSDDLVPAGMIHEVWVDEGVFKPVAMNVAGIFEASSDAIESGSPDDPYAPIDFDTHLVLDGASSHQVKRLRGPGAISEWPKRWLEAQGISDDQFALRGATHTIAEFVEARRYGPVTGTVIAKGGIGHWMVGVGSRMEIRDESGSMEVTIPPTVLEPGRGSTAYFEYDVTATAWTGPEPSIRELDQAGCDVTKLALQGRFDELRNLIPNPRPYIEGAQPITVTAKRPI